MLFCIFLYIYACQLHFSWKVTKAQKASNVTEDFYYDSRQEKDSQRFGHCMGSEDQQDADQVE